MNHGLIDVRKLNPHLIVCIIFGDKLNYIFKVTNEFLYGQCSILFWGSIDVLLYLTPFLIIPGLVLVVWVLFRVFLLWAGGQGDPPICNLKRAQSLCFKCSSGPPKIWLDLVPPKLWVGTKIWKNSCGGGQGHLVAWVGGSFGWEMQNQSLSVGRI